MRKITLLLSIFCINLTVISTYSFLTYKIGNINALYPRKLHAASLLLHQWSLRILSESPVLLLLEIDGPIHHATITSQLILIKSSCYYLPEIILFSTACSPPLLVQGVLAALTQLLRACGKNQPVADSESILSGLPD